MTSFHSACFVIRLFYGYPSFRHDKGRKVVPAVKQPSNYSRACPDLILLPSLWETNRKSRISNIRSVPNAMACGCVYGLDVCIPALKNYFERVAQTGRVGSPVRLAQAVH